MSQEQRYSLIYSPLVKQHLKGIEPKHHLLIRKTIEKELQFQPGVETEKKKPLKLSVVFEPTWELHFGPDNRFQAFYEIDKGRHEVRVLGVGVNVLLDSERFFKADTDFLFGEPLFRCEKKETVVVSFLR